MFYRLAGVTLQRRNQFQLTNLIVPNIDDQYPFWIKTAPQIGQENAVTTGIKGTGQGKTDGLLIWETTNISEGTYYYEAEHNAGVGGIIRVGPKFEGTRMLKFSFHTAYNLPKIA